MLLKCLHRAASEPPHAPEQMGAARRGLQDVGRIRELRARLNRIKNILRSVVSVQEEMSDRADRLPAPRSLMWCHCVDRHVNVGSGRVLGPQPGLELRALYLLYRTNALCDTTGLV